MLFNSLHFLIFFPIITILFYLLKHKWRWILLFAASTYFYSAFYLPYIIILYAIIIIDYLCGLLIEKNEGKMRLFWLLISIISNLGLLFYFKYYNFFIENFVNHFPLIYKNEFIVNHNLLKHINIILPIGLSFHTFQSLSYTIEVYKKKQVAEKHIGYFSNYVLFFSQMVAGPIETYKQLGKQLKTKQNLKYQNIANGLRLILYGLFVKMCIADNLAPLVNEFYLNPTFYYSSSAWVALFAFSIQIYADFYGYSTIAIGSARLLGIKLINNFNQPYFSISFYQFWQRWHISLTTWFRTYVFFPLGGSYVNNFRWIFNILFVFSLSGFWHGANYTFLVWGFLHGMFYIMEKGILRIIPIKFSSNIIYKIIGTILTFILVTLIWVFFRSDNIKSSLTVLNQCITYSAAANKNLQINFSIIATFSVFLIIEFLIIKSRFDKFIKNRHSFIRWFCYVLLFLSILLFSGIQGFQFIYFQF